MTAGRVKNWGEFQHYKDRSPPWIKLHRALLDDFHFTSLPLASKALAPLVWLLAAESSDGSVNLDPDWLAWRLRIPVEDVREGLSPLIERGFLELASNTLAACKQPAIPEGEGEGETEGEARASKRAGTRQKKIPLPDDFAISERVKAWAARKGHTRLDERFEQFVGASKARGYTYADWDEAFMNAIRDDWAKFGSGATAKPGGGRREL